MEAKGKVNKNEFLRSISEEYNVPLAEVRMVFDAMVEGIKNVVCSGKDLSLTGFGTFSLRRHKGHPVQFEAKSDVVSDYVVLKFTASDVLMTKIRDAYSRGVAIAKG